MVDRLYVLTDSNGRPTGLNLTQVVDMVSEGSLDAGLGAMYEIAEEMVGLAKEYTPVGDGTLRASADEVGLNEEAGPDWRAIAFGFGGAAATYAAAIHEYPNTIFSAETQARRAQMGTGWKFLQRAVEELADGVEERMAEGIAARLEGDLGNLA